MGLQNNLLENKLEDEYMKLRSELELFRIDFILNKKCRCKCDDCSHYIRKRDDRFSKKIDVLFNLSFKSGLDIFLSKYQRLV